MKIVKRNGTIEQYCREKIAVAMQKSFLSAGSTVDEGRLHAMVDAVEQWLRADASRCSVEQIQDEVERVLMENGFYDEAKRYILYRFQRTAMRDAVRQLAERSGWPSIHDVLVRVQHDFPDERYALTRLAEKFSAFCKPGMSAPRAAEGPDQGSRGADHAGCSRMGIHCRPAGDFRHTRAPQTGAGGTQMGEFL